MKGRRLLVVGSVLIATSVIGGLAAAVLLAGRLDLQVLERDVVVAGPRQVAIPGELRFGVDRPLDEGADATMTVGVAVRDAEGVVPRCVLSGPDGRDVPLRAPRLGSSLLSGDRSATVVYEADLGPDDYVVSCRWPGEPSGTPAGARFTVGRVLGDGELRALMGPMLGLLAVAAVAMVLFVAGSVCVVVGLVRRSRGSGGPGRPGLGPRVVHFEGTATPESPRRRQSPDGPFGPPGGPSGAWSPPATGGQVPGPPAEPPPWPTPPGQR